MSDQRSRIKLNVRVRPIGLEPTLIKTLLASLRRMPEFGSRLHSSNLRKRNGVRFEEKPLSLIGMLLLDCVNESPLQYHRIVRAAETVKQLGRLGCHVRLDVQLEGEIPFAVATVGYGRARYSRLFIDRNEPVNMATSLYSPREIIT